MVVIGAADQGLGLPIIMGNMATEEAAPKTKADASAISRLPLTQEPLNQVKTGSYGHETGVRTPKEKREAEAGSTISGDTPRTQPAGADTSAREGAHRTKDFGEEPHRGSEDAATQAPQRGDNP